MQVATELIPGLTVDETKRELAIVSAGALLDALRGYVVQQPTLDGLKRGITSPSSVPVLPARRITRPLQASAPMDRPPTNPTRMQVDSSVRNKGGGGQGGLTPPPPHNCTGPWHLCFSRGPRVGP